MTEIIRLQQGQPWTGGPRFPPDQLPSMVATAVRAPSVLNTQPWRFRVAGAALELHADSARALPVLDPTGREMLVSCGAALYGIRLAVRQLGYVPAVSLLPSPARPGLLARVYLAGQAEMTSHEWELLAAVPHRHTHRGPFVTAPIPPGLITGLQHDAVAEGAELVLITESRHYCRLAALVIAAGSLRRQAAQAEVRRWTRPPGSTARDGVGAGAYPALTVEGARSSVSGRLAQRDFDLGRSWGTAEDLGSPPAVTAVLTTASDTPLDWLQAGQALQRMLLRAASGWVFASMNTEPLEFPPIRALVRTGLGLAGVPQMVFQFGRVHTTLATARRPPAEVISVA
jgi:hypothetical protein